jgi:EAL domain-containing protein (putative c-di-GMP-specific phosphodiesterase class I)
MADRSEEEVNELRRALAVDELELYYQPIVRLPGGEVRDVEGLLRWPRAGGGTLMPGSFIPAAERSGLIETLGRWVVDRVCAQARTWRDQGLDARVGFNVSPSELSRPDFANTVGVALVRHGVDPSAVVAEITESAAMGSAGAETITLYELDRLGVTIVIDDFGAGHSSLGRLRQLPVDVLKLDRLFLESVPQDARASAMLTAMLRFVEELGITAVVEGVETEEQARFLVQQGCPYAQGRWFGAPMPADEAAVVMRAGQAERVPAVRRY